MPILNCCRIFLPLDLLCLLWLLHRPSLYGKLVLREIRFPSARDSNQIPMFGRAFTQTRRIASV
jgi:hypothetical protein